MADGCADTKAFLSTPRETAKARPAAERVQDFAPIYQPLDAKTVRAQAGRCLGCGVPFCQSNHGCPLANVIPDWNGLTAQDQWRGALAALHATNNFPEFTGQLCPAPCESACVLNINDAPVAIRQVELALAERGFSEGWTIPLLPSRQRPERIALVGSGPAGLAAAQQLRRRGFRVVVIEKADRIGGLLRYGIPDFKMDKAILDRRLAQLEAEGVEFVTGVEVGRDVTLAELRRDYDAVGLTVGAEEPRELDLPGRDLAGIVLAADFLSQQNRRMVGDDVHDGVVATGRRVVIIGGGDTGSDCLGTALRQGCLEAVQFELLPEPPRTRSKDRPWPLWPLKLISSHAHEEGGRRLFGVATTGFSGSDGAVKGVRVVPVTMAAGRLVPHPERAFEVAADLVVLAIGYSGVSQRVLSSLPGTVQRLGGSLGDGGAGYGAGSDGVFVAGDARRGASLIVWAIAEGRGMALAMERYLDLRSETALPHAVVSPSFEATVAQR